MNQRFVGLVFLTALGVPAPALAQFDLKDVIYEVRGGVLAHDVPLWGSGRVESGVAIHGEVAFAPSIKILGIDIRPVLGGSVATGGGTSLFYLDIRAELIVDRLFFAAGVGPAIHTGNLTNRGGNKALGSRVLFHPSFEFGIQLTPANRVSIYYEHISSAYIARPNPGMDNLGLRVSHRF